MKTSKKIAMVVAVIMLTLLLRTTKVRANYQSIPTSSRTQKNATTWVIGIRQMEKSGQAMGLTETINTSNALATSESNNIDVHLQKNTEYGAAILLGASNYGKQGSDITARRMDKGATSTRGTDVKATTTGNVTGIYEMGYYDMNISKTKYEWTAGGGTSFLSSIAPRYRNIYTTATGKVGDATAEKWHGSTNNNLATGKNGVVRGEKSAFTCIGEYPYGSAIYYGRAAVVCGTGL